MNVARGLFRAWIVISILWVIGAGSFSYVIVSRDTVLGSFQPTDALKEGGGGPGGWAEGFPRGLIPYRIDQKAFYEYYRSPSAERLTVKFLPMKWDGDFSRTIAEMADGSRIYMSENYTDADKDYIAKQFWDQRWSRYAYTAGIIALWALVPCIALFILGYALLWIGRGFKHA